MRLTGLDDPVNDGDVVNKATLVSTAEKLRDELVGNIQDANNDIVTRLDILRTDTLELLNDLVVGSVDSNTSFSFTNLQDTTIKGTLSGKSASFAEDVDASAFISKSDMRLKRNVAPIEQALEKIGQIRGYNFEWVDGSGPSIGVLAQEIQEILPCAVSERNEYLHVDYAKIIPLLVECVRELSAKVELLSNKS
jgi:hypothetical protein